MSTPLVVNGVTFNYPTFRDNNWADVTTNWATAVSNSTLQLTAGDFNITNELNLGPNFGLKSLNFSSRSADPSLSGIVRLANSDVMTWRNGANDADLQLSISNNRLAFDGSIFVTTGSSDTLTNKTIDADLNTLSNLEVSDFKASAIGLNFTGTSNNQLPTTLAVEAEIDQRISNERNLPATLVNKTLTSPVINGGSVNNATVASATVNTSTLNSPKIINPPTTITNTASTLQTLNASTDDTANWSATGSFTPTPTITLDTNNRFNDGNSYNLSSVSTASGNNRATWKGPAVNLEPGVYTISGQILKDTGSPDATTLSLGFRTAGIGTETISLTDLNAGNIVSFQFNFTVISQSDNTFVLSNTASGTQSFTFYVDNLVTVKNDITVDYNNPVSSFEVGELFSLNVNATNKITGSETSLLLTQAFVPLQYDVFLNLGGGNSSTIPVVSMFLRKFDFYFDGTNNYIAGPGI